MSWISELSRMVAPETLSILADQRRRIDASVAGAALRTRPRRRDRKFSGRIGSHRVHQGRLVRLADGRTGQVERAIRGLVVVRIPDLDAVAGYREVVVRADDLELVRDPAAVLLGGLKRGVTERPSPRKRRTARKNGKRPCRPGRRRGRPPRLRP